MTNERAIELLNRISDSQFDGPYGDERREALEMAVRALSSQQTDTDSQGLVNDCISRKMAIDGILMFMPVELGKGASMAEQVNYSAWETAISCAESYVRTMPPAQPHWIPCSERLPEAEYGESDNVLTTCIYKDAVDGYRSVKTLYYNGGVWCYPTGETFEGKVLAWMSLPEPYGGETK